MQKLRRWMAGWGTAMLTGALFFVVLGRVEQPHGVVQLGLFGALYALGVLGLVRLFAVRRWGLVVAGLLCGPVPLAILWSPNANNAGERGGILLATLLLGLLVGLLEWARQAKVESDVRGG